MFSIAGLFVMFAGIVGSGTMVGLLGWFFLRIRQLEARVGSDEDLRRLLEHLDDLRENLDITRQDVAELTERLDFTERLLGSGDPSGRRQGKLL